MEKFEITILGCGSATPGLKHFTSSQVLNIREKLFMIDCGEGTQIQMRRTKIAFGKLNQKISKCTAPNKELFLQYYN